MDVVIYHNPRCSKSRETLALLEAEGIQPRVRLYLEAPPDKAELQQLLAALGLPATALLRTKEPLYATLVAAEGAPDAERALRWLCAHPILMERPVVRVGGRARIGRPPEAALELLRGG